MPTDDKEPAPVAEVAAPASDATAVQADQPEPAAAAPDSSSPEAAADAYQPTLLDKATEGKPAEPEKVPAEAEAKPEAAADEKPAAEAKPETPAEEPEKVEEAAEPPPLEPIDYFAEDGGVKLPETLRLDDANKTELITALDAMRADPVKGAQALIDLHAKQIQALSEHVTSEQWRTFRETNDTWAKQVLADPVLGGAGHETAMKKVATGRDLLVSTSKPGTPQFEKDLADFHEMARITGVGNHPAFLRMLHNASRLVREGQLPPPDPKPPKDAGKDPRTRGKLDYSNTNYGN